MREPVVRPNPIRKRRQPVSRIGSGDWGPPAQECQGGQNLRHLDDFGRFELVLGAVAGKRLTFEEVTGRPAKERATARAERGVTQEDLAHDAGITTGTLSVIERGQSNPTWETVRSIARALGVSMAELAKAAERLEDD